jgi:ATP-dependent exoDNAse (exonuclease V) beta subunit
VIPLIPPELVLIHGAITDPTEEQLEAIRSLQKNLVVSAAAGSGKTRVLVERYLTHIERDGLRPDQILAITFTRKAAAEMKRRIVDRLTANGRYGEAQIAETGPIQTIHSFCERILRENSIQAGIDPDFEILANADVDRLMGQAVDNALADLSEDHEEAMALVRELAGQRSFSESTSPHNRLEEAIKNTISKWRGTSVDRAYLSEIHRHHVPLLALWRDKLLAQAPQAVQESFFADKEQQAFGIKLSRAYKSVKAHRPGYLRATTDGDIKVARQTCGLMQLVVDAWARYEGKMKALQTLDFAALEVETLRLLRTSDAAKYRVRKQYRVVLVDESQDLNPIQHELLEALNPDTQMFVGDQQQSIYGFRQADPTLFEKRRTTGPGTRLSKNHRSELGILGFVDHLFGQRWGSGYTPMLDRKMNAFPGVELWLQRQKDLSLTAAWVRECIDDWRSRGGKASDVAVLVRKSEYGLRLQEALEAAGVAARLQGGADRFYARLEVRDLANALEAMTDPYDDFALFAVLRSPFAGLSLDALVLLKKSGSLLDALHHADALLPIDLVEDRRLVGEFLAWFDPLVVYADRLSAWELISQFFAKTPYLENLARREDAAQRIANVRKLLGLAAKSSDVGPREFAEAIREIQEIRHREGDAPAGDEDADEVTIMTIHKSKGLEFPVVILPDTHERMSRQSQDVEVDPQLGLVTARFEKTASMFHEWLAAERRVREEEEEWRVAYVAMTRAKKKLCVMVNPTSGEHLANEIYKLLKSPIWPPLEVRIREAENLRR